MTPHRWLLERLPDFAAGAALALVSQIYNLPGDWTDLLLPWCLVSLPLAWIMPSHGVAVFYLCGIAIWCVARSAPPQPAGSLPPYGYLPLLNGILPLWPGPAPAARPPAGSRWVLAASAFVARLAVRPEQGEIPSPQGLRIETCRTRSGAVTSPGATHGGRPG